MTLTPPKLSPWYRARRLLRAVGRITEHILAVLRVLADIVYLVFLAAYLLGGVAPALYTLLQTRGFDHITWADLAHVLLFDQLKFSPEHGAAFILSLVFLGIFALGTLLVSTQLVERFRQARRATKRDDTVVTSSTREAAKARLKSIEPAWKNPHLFSFLRWKYASEPIFERGGVTFPLAVYPAPLSQRTDPESALVRPIVNRFPEDETLFKDTTMRELVQQAGRPAVNLATFALDTLEVDETVRISCHMGKYYDVRYPTAKAGGMRNTYA